MLKHKKVTIHCEEPWHIKKGVAIKNKMKEIIKFKHKNVQHGQINSILKWFHWSLVTCRVAYQEPVPFQNRFQISKNSWFDETCAFQFHWKTRKITQFDTRMLFSVLQTHLKGVHPPLIHQYWFKFFCGFLHLNGQIHMKILSEYSCKQWVLS